MTPIDVDRSWRLLIGGDWVEPASRTYEIVDQPHPYAPFGGFEMSLVGRDRGRRCMAAYREIQAIDWMA